LNFFLQVLEKVIQFFSLTSLSRDFGTRFLFPSLMGCFFSRKSNEHENWFVGRLSKQHLKKNAEQIDADPKRILAHFSLHLIFLIVLGAKSKCRGCGRCGRNRMALILLSSLFLGSPFFTVSNGADTADLSEIPTKRKPTR